MGNYQSFAMAYIKELSSYNHDADLLLSLSLLLPLSLPLSLSLSLPYHSYFLNEAASRVVLFEPELDPLLNKLWNKLNDERPLLPKKQKIEKCGKT